MTPDAVLEQLPSIRERGYAVDDQENEPHVRCIGAPVLDAAARVIGAVSVSGPDFRLDAASLGCPKESHPLASLAFGPDSKLGA